MVLITIIGLSIGYSAFNTDLSISGEANFIVNYDIAKSKILNDNGGQTFIESKGNPDFTKMATTNEGIYATVDNDGTSYYYRGDVDNNWLYFAGYYWRIIRVNGNGSVRLIYNGEEPVETGNSTIIGNVKFNEETLDNAYMGYMYGTPGSSTYTETHANINDSNVKKVVDAWYVTYLSKYEPFLDQESNFCGDRSTSTVLSSMNHLGGYGTTITYYGEYLRVYITKTPTLKCQNINDYYTLKNNSKGNQALTYPVGLLAGDEVIFAGSNGQIAENNNYFYLYTGLGYWSMTPYWYNGYNVIGAHMFYVYPNGMFGYGIVNALNGVRPVINLKANTMLSGTGTVSDPYKVVNTT